MIHEKYIILDTGIYLRLLKSKCRSHNMDCLKRVILDLIHRSLCKNDFIVLIRRQIDEIASKLGVNKKDMRELVARFVELSAYSAKGLTLENEKEYLRMDKFRNFFEEINKQIKSRDRRGVDNLLGLKLFEKLFRYKRIFVKLITTDHVFYDILIGKKNKYEKIINENRSSIIRIDPKNTSVNEIFKEVRDP